MFAPKGTLAGVGEALPDSPVLSIIELVAQDGQLEFHRLPDGQVGRLFALENSPGVATGQAPTPSLLAPIHSF
jgi:hypothetical protein